MWHKTEIKADWLRQSEEIENVARYLKTNGREKDKKGVKEEKIEKACRITKERS